MGRYAGGLDMLGLSYHGTKFARLPWSAANDETITPGSGGVPRGVVALAWQPAADNQACSMYWDASSSTGTAACSGTPSGWLLVWYRGSQAAS